MTSYYSEAIRQFLIVTDMECHLDDIRVVQLLSTVVSLVV